MPWASKAQQKWGNSSSGQKELGAAKVHEYNEATKRTKGGFAALTPKVKKKSKK